MKKRNFLMMATILFGMTLAACGGNPAKSEENVTSNQSQEVNSGEQITSSEAPLTSSSEAPQTSSSEQVNDAAMDATGIDIVVENNVVYAKITGTISGFANADAMKMAFGLVKEAQQGQEATYIYGSATPADADYNLVPTVDATAGTFELKVDLSAVQWVGGTFTAMVGPKGFYKGVASTGGTYGTGKTIVGAFRISIRSHNGTIAADELPPVELTISRMEIEGDHIYHVLGGALNTAALPQADFLAKHPYVCYETTVSSQWKQNVLGSSTKTDLVTVSVDAQGNALIKTDVTSLPADNYNIKLNLSKDEPVDTKMDAIIDETERPVAFGMYDYICYADSTQSDKAHIYGNCGLMIKTANRYVNAGEKIADLQPVRSREGEIAYEVYAADCVGQTNPTYSNKNTRLGKNDIFTDVWEIEGIKSGEYEVYVKGAYSSGNGGAYWSGALQVANTNDKETGTENGNPYNPAYRYNFKVDSGTPVDCVSDKTYQESGLEGKDGGGWTKAAMATISVPDGAASFTMTNVNNGYSIWVYALRLVRVGNWTRPATQAAFTDGVMRVEAEAYHEASAEPTVETADGATYLKEVGGWPQFNASYKINFAEAVHVKLKLRYNWTTAQFGNYGAAEFRLDDSDTKIKDASGQDNLGQDNAGPTNAWAETFSAEFDITAGVHTFKFQTPGGCKVSWDYFELIVVSE